MLTIATDYHTSTTRENWKGINQAVLVTGKEQNNLEAQEQQQSWGCGSNTKTAVRQEVPSKNKQAAQSSLLSSVRSPIKILP
jgi:hypothetical protein